MCSNQDESYNPFLTDTANKMQQQNEDAEEFRRYKTVKGKCVKCKIADPVVTIRSNLYCKSCFLLNVDLKFRTALAKVYKKSEDFDENLPTAVVGLSGGPSSRSLLHLLHANNSSSKGKKFSRFIIVHVDESCLSPNPFDADTELDYMVQLSSRYGFECAVLRLEHVFVYPGRECLMVNKKSRTEVSVSVEALPINSHEPEMLLRGLLDNIQGNTTKEDVISYCKFNALLSFAKAKNATCLLLGDSSTKTAIKTISLTSKGRGSSLPVEIGNETMLESMGIQVIFPMREVTIKESSLFCGWNDLDLFDRPVAELTGKPSIDALTEKFLSDLDLEYPMTITTVCKTASRIKQSSFEGQQKFCIFCRQTIAYQDLQSFDRHVVDELPEFTDANAEKYSGCDGLFCYGCFQNFSTDLKNGRFILPVFCHQYFINNQLKDGVGQ